MHFEGRDLQLPVSACLSNKVDLSTSSIVLLGQDSQLWRQQGHHASMSCVTAYMFADVLWGQSLIAKCMEVQILNPVLQRPEAQFLAQGILLGLISPLRHAWVSRLTCATRFRSYFALKSGSIDCIQGLYGFYGKFQKPYRQISSLNVMRLSFASPVSFMALSKDSGRTDLLRRRSPRSIVTQQFRAFVALFSRWFHFFRYFYTTI